MPKPAAGWTPARHAIHPGILIRGKAVAPDVSWWAIPGLTRAAFTARAAAEWDRMSSSKLASYVNPASRMAE